MAEQTFPAWFYGPDGQSAICESADDVPKGWADHPGKAKAKVDPFDHDGDGEPGGSKPSTRRKVNRRDPGK